MEKWIEPLESMAQTMRVIATNIGKISLMPYYAIAGKDEAGWTLQNYDGKQIHQLIRPDSPLREA